MTHLALGLAAGQVSAAFLGTLPGQIDGLVDLLTIEDGFADAGHDGLDATLLANWLGARTRHVGLLPGATVNFLEPFHISTAIATLDYVTEGRAGLLAQPLRGARAAQARRAVGALAGFPDIDPPELAHDLAEAVEVIRLLWDSWEDDAVIRDPVSQRFVDGARLHYVSHQGARYSVLGPSITPRPPQGQPVVATSLEVGDDLAAAAGSDLVFLSAPDPDVAKRIAADLHARGIRPLIFADILVSFGRAAPSHPPALSWTGAPEDLPDQARAWTRQIGLAGLRFLPSSTENDLGPLSATVLPALVTGIAQATTLRERLGLPRAPNRYRPTVNAA